MSSRIEPGVLVEKLRARFPELRSLPPGLFVVGGAVRDLCLSRQPLDIDLASNDPKTAASGFAAATQGTLVELGRESFATFRVVVGRRVYDFNALLGGSVEQDAMRRDFTVNAIALALDPPRIIDPVGGTQDLQRRRIRMVREENFIDDPLRVLKAVRMAVALDFTIDPRTFEAMQRHAPGLQQVAPERVAYELDQILSPDERARGLMLLNQLELDLGLFGFPFAPDLIEAIALVGGDDPVVGYATLFFERGEGALNEFAGRWRWSEQQRRDALAAMEMARRVRESQHAELPILIYDYGLDAARRVVQLLHATGSDFQADSLGELLEARGESIAATTPLLRGEQIQVEAGVRPGPEIGRLKRAILEAQLRGEISTAGEAAELVRRLSGLLE